MERRFSDMLKESAKGSIILFLGQVGAAFITAIGSILIARIVGPSSYGILLIAQTPITFCNVFLSNGVNQALINFLAENRHKRNRSSLKNIIISGFIINVGLGFLTSLIVYLLAGYLANNVFALAELEVLIKILSISVIAGTIVNTSAAVLVGFERMSQKSKVTMIQSMLKSVTGPTLVFLGYGIVGAAFGLSIPLIITGTISMILVLSILKNLPKTSTISISKGISMIFNYALPLFFSNIISGGIEQVFKFVLPFYVTASVIGNYSAALNFSLIVNLLLMPLNMAIFPLFSKLEPKDSVFEYVFQSVIKYTSLLVFPISSLIISLANHLVLVLYGESYPLTPIFLQILMFNFFSVGFGGLGVLANLINSQKETKIHFRRMLIYTITSIPLGYYLIPRYGVIGLQITLFLAPKLGLVYALWWIKQRYNLNVDYSTLGRIIFSTIFAYLICELTIRNIVLNPWIEIFTGGFVFIFTYLFAILFSGAITRRNIEDIHNLVLRYTHFQPQINLVFKILEKLARY